MCSWHVLQPSPDSAGTHLQRRWVRQPGWRSGCSTAYLRLTFRQRSQLWALRLRNSSGMRRMRRLAAAGDSSAWSGMMIDDVLYGAAMEEDFLEGSGIESMSPQ